MTAELRERILAEIPERGDVLELGTGHGVTAAWWAERRPRVRFLSVDTFQAAKGTGPGIIEDWLANHLPNQHLFVGTAKDYVRLSGSVWYDVVFIDGGHGYQDCMIDLNALRRVVRQSGKMLVHDYGRKCHTLVQVTQAVNDFVKLEPWGIERVVGCVAVLGRDT